MSLAWVCEECATPFGPVRTYNWAVPDEDLTTRTYDNETDAVGFGHEDEEGMNPEELALESAQDQLGSVLWNSNTAALDHFCRLVVAQDAVDSNKEPCSVSGETVAKKRRTEDDDEESASQSPFASVDASDLTPAELAVSKSVLNGKTILELGSGVGVLGIALGLYGGAKAAITDIKELVPLMEKNIKESAKKVAQLPQHIVALSAAAAQGKLNNKNKATNANDKSSGKKNNNNRGNTTNSNAFATTIEGRGAKDAPEERGGICRAYAFRWGDALPSPLATFLGSRVQYIVMCDGLYGNPAEWPKLIENLKEIVAIAKKGIADESAAAKKKVIDSSDSDSDSDEDEKAAAKRKAAKKSARSEESAPLVVEDLIPHHSGNQTLSCYKSNGLPVFVNYCEQRVDQVEGAFMKLLKEKVPEWKVVGPTTMGAKSGMGMEVRVTTIYTR